MNPVGVMLGNLDRDRLRAFAVARNLGFEVIHANALPESWLNGPDRAAYVAAYRASGLTIASQFIGFDGQDYSSRERIAATVGAVRPELREHRFGVARQYGDLAADLGVSSLSLHLGFLPADSDHVDYVALVQNMRGLLDVCGRHRQSLYLETGQESARRLLGLIRTVDRPNLGVNFDPANFLIYGSDDPLAALELLHPLIGGVHCKDAVLPAQSGELGREVPLGSGAVNIPTFLRRLLEFGYAGPLVIEHKAPTDGPTAIVAARDYLHGLLGSR